VLVLDGKTIEWVKGMANALSPILLQDLFLWTWFWDLFAYSFLWFSELIYFLILVDWDALLRQLVNCTDG